MTTRLLINGTSAVKTLLQSHRSRIMQQQHAFVRQIVSRPESSSILQASATAPTTTQSQALENTEKKKKRTSSLPESGVLSERFFRSLSDCTVGIFFIVVVYYLFLRSEEEKNADSVNSKKSVVDLFREEKEQALRIHQARTRSMAAEADTKASSLATASEEKINIEADSNTDKTAVTQTLKLSDREKIVSHTAPKT